ncbi:DUF1471 domain-containing protein [Citrobacter freundii]|uniref:YdgH/BhsA/McbA-like domain-containing protein n=1 Tax=Citrobacter freundii TaxID=546 RepID=A0AA44NP62_CITFR|nr:MULTISPECIES: DUF1471 domain-containing protein [Citrobacter freundii complex]ANZ86290.1 hypothetical protein CfB38_1368 [Citrobacter freundii]EKW2054222.1 DUF1471 domain-containing protein [Citrobacter freundii]KYC21356.1 hypothetical protein WM45_08975 [Citrobacter sp. AATXR]MBJ8975537.1 DUF1471 domain-containing protein [Citrobacter freundii]MBJ9011803.1 DUF1471 domain-containing protein [Citrobacter freundii]
MKKLSIIALLGSTLVFSAYAAEQISPEQASKYTKIGELSVTEDGFTMTDDGLSKKVDEKGGKYYVITSIEGQSEHKTINVDIYK